jgi:hypothetical protein
MRTPKSGVLRSRIHLPRPRFRHFGTEELADDVRALSILVHALRGALISEGLILGHA